MCSVAHGLQQGRSTLGTGLCWLPGDREASAKGRTSVGRDLPGNDPSGAESQGLESRNSGHAREPASGEGLVTVCGWALLRSRAITG